ncbi:MAG: hypothetical protein CXT73_06975 [Methanobacteriota archaeon]|jgi:hypothetical protein|nr:MAG: hypothetical protein CXT73_06975 [Euryarchaeota archaeon]
MKNNRILNGEKVTRIRIYDYHSTPKIRGLSGGQINGETVLDKNGKPLPYNKIGELEGPTHIEDQVRRKSRSK